MGAKKYPVQFSVDYPNRDLARLSTGLRIFFAIPILLLVAAVESGFGASFLSDNWTANVGAVAGGLLFLPPMLMIVFRQRYPRWWFDWNLQLMRFQNRIGVYLVLMDDRYPSTEDEQAVRLDFPYPNAERDLNRWLPLVKWFLAIPHYIVLVVLTIAAFFATIGAWFAILFTGRYPRAIFDFNEGVIRWQNRVYGYAVILVTDEYPPFGFTP